MFFHRLFRRSTQVKRPSAASVDIQTVLRGAAQSIAELHGRVSKCELALRNLDEQHSTTVSQLNKLRGQVHGGRRGAARAAESDDVAYGDKDALRRRAGIVAGARFTHPTEQ